MTIPAIAEQRVENYLSRLRRLLRGMSSEDARETVEELRSHILDRAANNGELTAISVDAALAALGTPEELASQYTTNDLLARAEVTRSPFQVLKSLFRWASLSAAGFFVLAGSLLGYFLGGAFMWCGVLKFIHPRTAGLWLLPDNGGGTVISIRLGFGAPPAGGRDLLGWWIVPIGVLAGCGLVMVTTHFAIWCGRKYRESHLLPVMNLFERGTKTRNE